MEIKVTIELPDNPLWRKDICHCFSGIISSYNARTKAAKNTESILKKIYKEIKYGED